MRYGDLVKYTNQEHANAVGPDFWATIVNNNAVQSLASKRYRDLSPADGVSRRIDDAIEFLSAKARVEAAGESDNRPAVKIINWLGKVKTIMTTLEESNNAVDPEAKEKAFDNAMKELETFGVGNRGIQTEMHEYFDKYGFSEFRRSDVSFISALTQSMENACNKYLSEDRKLTAEECLDLKEGMDRSQEELTEECKKFYRDIYTTTGISPTGVNLDETMRRLQLTISGNQKYLKEQTKLLKQAKSLNRDAAEKLDRIDDALSQFHIAEMENTYNKLEELALKMEQADKSEMVGREKIMESDKVLLGSEKEKNDALEERMKTIKSRIVQREGCQANIKLLKENPESKALIDEYENVAPRCKALERAWNELKSLAETGQDIGKILKAYEKDPADPELNDDTRRLAERYYNAREDIIANLNSSKENQQSTRDAFASLEADGGNIPAFFMAEYGAPYQTGLHNLSERLEELEGTKVIKDYCEYCVAIQETEDCKAMYDEAMEQQKELLDRAKTIKDDYEKQNETLIKYTKEFCKLTGTTCEPGKRFTFEQMQERLADAKLKLKERMDTVKSDIRYKDLMEDRRAAKKEYDRTLPANIKERIAKADKDIADDTERFKYLLPFKARYDGLRTEGKMLTEYDAKLKKDCDFMMKATNNSRIIGTQLAVLGQRLMDKSPKDHENSDSREFKALSSALDHAFEAFTQGGFTPENRKDALLALGDAADKYLYEKGRQTRPYPFASDKRYARLSAARNILNFCPRHGKDGQIIPGTASDIMDNVSPNEQKVMEFIKGDSKLGYDFAMFKAMKELQPEKLKAGSMDKVIEQQRTPEPGGKEAKPQAIK